MDKLRHSPTLLDHVLEVRVRILDEQVNSILVSEYTVFLIVLENTQIRLSWH